MWHACNERMRDEKGATKACMRSLFSTVSALVFGMGHAINACMRPFVFRFLSHHSIEGWLSYALLDLDHRTMIWKHPTILYSVKNVGVSHLLQSFSTVRRRWRYSTMRLSWVH